MKIKLQDVRLAFAEIFTAKKFQGTGEAAYSACLIIDPKKTRAFDEAGKPVKLTDAIEAVAKDKWGGKAAAVLAEMRKKDNVCFRTEPKTNASGEVYDGFDGMYHISTRGKTRPLVIDRDKRQLTAEDGVVYSGCYVNASLELWAQDNSYGKRINATLRGVQFLRDGDAFVGGSPASEDEFEDLSEGATADGLV